MTLPKVRLVVLNYNGGELVERCVRHLEALEWPEDRLEIVVVDNASTDGSDRCLERRPRVRLIRSGANRGFPANNLGLTDLGDVDHVGLVNNDAFADARYLQPLVAALEADERLGAVCPKIVLEPRFLALSITAPTFSSPGDGRELSVRLSGLEVDGGDVWRSTSFGRGCHQLEDGPPAEGPFRWLAGTATISVPVGAPGGEAPKAPEGARLRLAAPRPVTVVLDGGGGVVEATVADIPRWVEVPLGGSPYDIINNVGSILIEGGWGADRGFLERDTGQYDQPQDVFAWCGAGVLFRRSYLEDVGGFDDRFFMYYEDFDLSWRGRVRGWRYRYVPEAVLRHVHAATSVEGSPLFQHFVERNRLVMLLKNAPRRWVLGAIAGFLLATASYARRDVVLPLLRGCRPRPAMVWARLRSFGAFLGLVPHAWRERRRIEACRVVHEDLVVGWAVPR